MTTNTTNAISPMNIGGQSLVRRCGKDDNETFCEGKSCCSAEGWCGGDIGKTSNFCMNPGGVGVENWKI